MKKFIAVFFVLLLLSCMVISIPAFSADNDFVIEDGALIKYTGSSTSVTVPSSVRVVSQSAFEGNTTITSVKLHSDVYSIGDRAFYGCASLKEVLSHSSVEHVGALAFYDTKFFNESEDEFLTVGSALVRYNGTAENVVLPDTIESVSAYAFIRNKDIKTFTASYELSSIDEGAFYECTSLSDVNVTDSLYFVGADAFYKTPFITTKSDFVIIGNGILVVYNGSDSDVSIPSYVRTIAPNAFINNNSIQKVSIPASVFSVGERAFLGCTSLSELSLSSGLVMIDDEAFAHCKNLKTLNTPPTLSKIGKGAFIKCTGLEIVYIMGESLSIDYGAFAHCTKLESALLSDDVSAVVDDAFSYCGNLRFITAPDSVIMISSDAFTGCSDLTVICDKNSFAYSSLSKSLNVSFNRGDAKTDGEIDIIDATSIQRYIASMGELSNHSIAFADADFDATISIMDATYVQRIIAKLL